MCFRRMLLSFIGRQPSPPPQVSEMLKKCLIWHFFAFSSPLTRRRGLVYMGRKTRFNSAFFFFLAVSLFLFLFCFVYLCIYYVHWKLFFIYFQSTAFSSSFALNNSKLNDFSLFFFPLFALFIGFFLKFKTILVYIYIVSSLLAWKYLALPHTLLTFSFSLDRHRSFSPSFVLFRHLMFFLSLFLFFFFF